MKEHVTKYEVSVANICKISTKKYLRMMKLNYQITDSILLAKRILDGVSNLRIINVEDAEMRK